MSGLLFLSSNDFSIKRGNRGNIMCTDIPGFSLILFYSTSCQWCNVLTPIFKRLPGTINGCQFGMINVSNNKKCVQMASNTVAPITYVPYILFYVDGKPFMVYKGPYDHGEITKFVLEVANNISKKRQFSAPQQKQASEHKDIPGFTIGIPIHGDNKNICYLDYDDAYTNQK